MKKEDYLIVAWFIFIFFVLVISSPTMDERNKNREYKQGIEDGIVIAFDTLQKILDKEVNEDKMKERVSKLTLVSYDTVTYYLSPKTIGK